MRKRWIYGITGRENTKIQGFEEFGTAISIVLNFDQIAHLDSRLGDEFEGQGQRISGRGKKTDVCLQAMVYFEEAEL